jgi:hypothetical protein
MLAATIPAPNAKRRTNRRTARARAATCVTSEVYARRRSTPVRVRRPLRNLNALLLVASRLRTRENREERRGDELGPAATPNPRWPRRSLAPFHTCQRNPLSVGTPVAVRSGPRRPPAPDRLGRHNAHTARSSTWRLKSSFGSAGTPATPGVGACSPGSWGRCGETLVRTSAKNWTLAARSDRAPSAPIRDRTTFPCPRRGIRPRSSDTPSTRGRDGVRDGCAAPARPLLPRDARGDARRGASRSRAPRRATRVSHRTRGSTRWLTSSDGARSSRRARR